jgi:hypothetical protein
LPRYALALLLAVGCGDAPTAPTTRSGPDPVPAPVDLAGAWRTSSAPDEGFDSAALDRAFEDAEAFQNLRALVVVRNGQLVREAYYGARAETPPSIFDRSRKRSLLCSSGSRRIKDCWISTTLSRPGYSTTLCDLSTSRSGSDTS